MNVVLLGACTAALAGPAVLTLAQRTSLLSYAPGPRDVASATTVAGLTATLVLARQPAELAMLLPVIVLGGAAAVVDAREGRLPNALTGPLLLGSLVAVLVAGRSLIGVAAAVALLLVLKMTAAAAVGWGDVKLLPSLVAVLIVQDAVLTGIVLMALLVALSALLVGLSPGRRSAVVPYGPALVVGTLVAAVGL